VWLAMGALSAYLANNRGRDPYVWFALGLLFGILGIVVLMFLPVYKKDDAKTIGDLQKTEKILTITPIVTQPVQQYLSVDWFYLDKEGKQQGPISFDGFKEKWKNKEIEASTFVWCESMKDWKRIEDLEDLQNVL